MPDPKRERDRLRSQNRRLRQELADLRRAVGWYDEAYCAVICDLAEIAIHAVHRPTDLGGPITTNHAESRPPIVLSTKPSRAYDLLRKERVDQRKRASSLRSKYLRLVDGDKHDEAPDTSRSGAGLC